MSPGEGSLQAAYLLSPWALAILGLCIGSFLNVVIHRLPRMLERQWRRDSAELLGLEDAAASDAPLSLARPRSHCPACGTRLSWAQNIPLFSYLALRGRCAACGVRISPRYPLVELGCALLFALIGYRLGAQATTLLWCGFAAVLLALAVIDWDTTLLPDDLTLPLIGLGLVAAWLKWTSVALPDAALGAFFGYFSLWFVAFVYKLVRGVQGMAEGDFKLLAGLGALLGWQALPSIILLSSAVGAVVGVFMILARGHGRNVPIPFGPYLAGGGVCALFFGAQLSQLWPMP